MCWHPIFRIMSARDSIADEAQSEAQTPLHELPLTTLLLYISRPPSSPRCFDTKSASLITKHVLRSDHVRYDQISEQLFDDLRRKKEC